MACASTVAVVVPSPATSAVLDATCLTICAPMFSNLTLSSISLATDTPSLVMTGAPKLRSSSTLRPFGPKVTFTALANTFTPLTMRVRAWSRNSTSLALISVLLNRYGCWVSSSLLESFVFGLDDSKYVVLAHDENLFAVHLDGLTGVLAKQYSLAHFNLHGRDGAVLLTLSITDGQY